MGELQNWGTEAETKTGHNEHRGTERGAALLVWREGPAQPSSLVSCTINAPNPSDLPSEKVQLNAAHPTLHLTEGEKSMPNRWTGTFGPCTSHIGPQENEGARSLRLLYIIFKNNLLISYPAMVTQWLHVCLSVRVNTCQSFIMQTVPSLVCLSIQGLGQRYPPGCSIMNAVRCISRTLKGPRQGQPGLSPLAVVHG